MKTNKKWGFPPKRFDDLLPKLDNGNTDWETVNQRVSLNMDATEIILGKLPPQALEIEEAILGACLIDIDAFKKANDVLEGFLNPFYMDTHNAIWAAMKSLDAKKESIDRLTVFLELELLQKVTIIEGNPYFLVKLTEGVSSSAHVESHSRILLEKFLRRRMMHESIKFFQKVIDPSTDFLDTIDEHKYQLNRLTDFKPVLKGIYFPKVMEKAKKATTKAFLVGS
jgi:replicative DNA helicase